LRESEIEKQPLIWGTQMTLLPFYLKKKKKSPHLSEAAWHSATIPDSFWQKRFLLFKSDL
jgi:hypothetical protein